MLNKNGVRELAYVAKVVDITPMNADRLECVHIGGWHCVVGKGEFKVGDLGVFFEIDSLLPNIEPFSSMEFLVGKHFKIKTQKIRGEYSQGLFMPLNAFEGLEDVKEGDFLTERLGVTYATVEDRKRKSSKDDPLMKYKRALAFHPQIAKRYGKFIMKHGWSRVLFYLIFGGKSKRNGNDKKFPVGVFEGVTITDQERVENMTWVLEDKTPYIVTEKCDGSSATYILARTNKVRKPFEYYVCSRRVRMLDKEQETFFGADNPYWDVEDKYDIYIKMKNYLDTHPNTKWVCWQGEICSPKIQGNPHHLKDIHFYCFHWTDSENGRLDIRDASEFWKKYEMEIVPIVDTNYILPDDFEEFKKTADGYYSSVVCEYQTNCPREGYVYYKTTDPTFSFKNVSREYLARK